MRSISLAQPQIHYTCKACRNSFGIFSHPVKRQTITLIHLLYGTLSVPAYHQTIAGWSCPGESCILAWSVRTSSNMRKHFQRDRAALLQLKSELEASSHVKGIFLCTSYALCTNSELLLQACLLVTRMERWCSSFTMILRISSELRSMWKVLLLFWSAWHGSLTGHLCRSARVPSGLFRLHVP